MIAVDTNVLIYACDQADAKRQKVALDLITSTQDGVLLWQVGCEFISASRKLHKHSSLVVRADVNGRVLIERSQLHRRLRMV